MRKEHLSELRHKEKCSRGRSRGGLGMPRPNWRSARKVSTSTFAAQEKLEKTWSHVGIPFPTWDPIPLLNGAEELKTNYMRKDEVLNASASVSTGKPSLQESQTSQAR